MRRPGKALLMAGLASVVGATAGQAQGGIALGHTNLGAVIGLGGIGGASVSLGGRWERVFKALPDIGDGLLGIQVGADWWSWNQRWSGTQSSSVSWIPIGVTANYHFKMENKKIDPFLGAGLGYEIVNASCEINGVDYCGGSYSSGIYVITKAGIRYFLNSKTALYADVGVGGATLNVGGMWKMK